ncbi:hypothetical protein BV898_06810 [Hypsibius exemplaris]|uniref:Uncharacterized protein n=1 Tax=Hypsibius exemplaris TaxID=2072580 RepID=A0A1W0WVK1_HYPEX|nr:hypothetical protein BV898_06810 [Hypsibius exemplaris]
MAFHLGRKEFIENLSSDVLDVEHTIRRLTSHLPAGAVTLRSWKYPGTNCLDVDTSNLVNCFRFNARNSDDSVKAHLIITELLIDRLVAFLFVCASLMEEQISTGDPNKALLQCERKLTERNTIAAVATYFGRIYLSFLTTWGIGVPSGGATVDGGTQTDEEFKPHAPCPECPWKCQWLEDVCAIIRRSVYSQLEDLKDAKSAAKVKHMYNCAVAENKDVKEATRLLETDMADSKALITRKETEIRATQKRIETVKKDFLQTGAEKSTLENSLKELEVAAGNSQAESAAQLTENQLLQTDLEGITSSCGVLAEQTKAYESKIRARRTVYELSALSMREQNGFLLENVRKMKERIQEVEKVYDPQWQMKLREVEEKVKSVRELFEDSDGLAKFHDGRIVDLNFQHNQLVDQNQNLQAELKRLQAGT